MATETTTTSPRLFQFRNIGRRRSPSSPTFDDTSPLNSHRPPRRASFAQQQQATPLSVAAAQQQSELYPPSLSSPSGINSFSSSSVPTTTTTTTTTGSSRPFASMLRRSSNRREQSHPLQPSAAAAGRGTGSPTTATQAHHHQNTTTNNEASAPHNPNPALNATMRPPSNAVNVSDQPTTNQAAPIGSGQQQQQGVQVQTHQNPRPLPGTVHRIRLIPHLESARSLPFEPIVRDAIENGPALRVGRFTDRQTAMASAPNAPNALKIAFRSKVVSRGHAEIWVESGGKFFLRDTKSSSGTFLNSVRLANANVESRPFPLKDGDIIQLGIDYQGGQQEIYRCVKIKVEIGREWQSAANAFNTSALRRLQAFGVTNVVPSGILLGPASSLPPNLKPQFPLAPPSSLNASSPLSSASPPNLPLGASSSASHHQLQQQHSQLQLQLHLQQQHQFPTIPQPASSLSAPLPTQDCCICLFPVTVCQALFVAPCSHAFHYKCMRPMLLAHHPGFSCPLCRSFSDLESDVEVEVPEGYLHFGAGGVVIGGLEGTLQEEPQQREQPAINDTSKLARAICIGSNPPNSAGALAMGTGSAGEQQQYASNAAPPISSEGPAMQNENSEGSREGEGSEVDAMVTSELEDHVGGLAIPRRERVDDSSEEDDDDDEAIDPGARVTRRMMYRRGRTHTDGEEEDEDEEDEVDAHVASVPASVDADSDFVEAEATPPQSRPSNSHIDGGASSNSSSSSNNNAANNQEHLRAGVPYVRDGGRAMSSSGDSAAGEGMMILDDFLDDYGDFDPNARAHAYVSSEIGDDEEGEGEEVVDEMGALAPHGQGSRGGPGSGNVTMVAGEKRKRRAV